MKKNILLILIISIITANLSTEPLRSIYYYVRIIEESQIPMPEIQYELPEALIGEFIMISHMYNHEITIFPNNKFIAITYVPVHGVAYSYGHIISIDDKWFFSPAPDSLQGYIRWLTEIFLTDTGFSYYFEMTRPVLFSSIRKENIPTPINLAEDISIPRIDSKHQYFTFNNHEAERFEFNEIENVSHRLVWAHRLQIGNGIVRLMRSADEFVGSIVFEGFMEKTEEESDFIKGIIMFTNGVSYFYIQDGIAEIEINRDGNIIISMLYTPDPMYMSEKAHELEFPARLVLEF